MYSILELNLIATLPPELFNKLVSQPSMTIGLNENPWICNCQFLEMTSLLNWNTIGLNRTILSPPIDCIRTNVTVTWPSANECVDRLQFIHPLKMCLGNKRKVNKYIYSKFVLRVDQMHGHLVIKTNVQDAYRIWFHSIESHYANTPNMNGNLTCNIAYPAKSYGCLTVTKNSANITLNRLFLMKNVGKILICIDYVHTNYMMMFWPLHCVLYNPNNNDLNDVLSAPNYLFMLIIATIIIIVGICLGFIGHILVHVLRNKFEIKNDKSNVITKAEITKVMTMF